MPDSSIARIVTWLLGSKSTDPLVRYGRLALVLFAIAATVTTYSKGNLPRLIFVAMLVVAFVLILWLISEIIKARTPALARFGHILAGAMLIMVVALFLATTAYRVRGEPAFIGRVLGGPNNTVDSFLIPVYLVTDKIIAGPIPMSLEKDKTLRDLVDKIVTKLTPKLGPVPPSVRIFSMSQGKYLEPDVLVSELVRVDNGPFLLSKEEHPDIIYLGRMSQTPTSESPARLGDKPQEKKDINRSTTKNNSPSITRIEPPPPVLCGQGSDSQLTEVTDLRWGDQARVISTGLVSRSVWVIRLTVPSDEYSTATATTYFPGLLNSAEYAGPPTTRDATLSRFPCDFGPVDAAGTSGPLASVSGTIISLRFKVGVSQRPDPSLVQGETYYLNIRNHECGADRCEALVSLNLPMPHR